MMIEMVELNEWIPARSTWLTADNSKSGDQFQMQEKQASSNKQFKN